MFYLFNFTALQRLLAQVISCSFRGFGNNLANHGVNQLLHAIERNHLANQQVDHKRLQALTLLQGTVPIGREFTFNRCLTGWTLLNLCIFMFNDFFKNNVNLGASFVMRTGNPR